MSYPKKSISTTKAFSANPTLTGGKREKLLAIQDKEKLKSALVNQLYEKYGKDRNYLTKLVTDFIKNEKPTEENLKKLEQKIRFGPGVTTSQKNNIPSLQNIAENNGQIQGGQDQDSLSEKAKSVVALGDNDDEWAAMVNYDHALYKKEKFQEKVKEQERKRMIKAQLDKQIAERKKAKVAEAKELKNYIHEVEDRLKEASKVEKEKELQMKGKIIQEKYSRDKQLQDENNRKKQLKKSEKEMDELLVKKIKEDMSKEAKIIAEKRVQDREAFKKILEANEEKKKRALLEAKKEREADIKAQQEYTKMIEKQEANRAAELKAREERAKKFMNMMADTVVKDQRAQILEEERKLLKAHLEKEKRDHEDEKRREQAVKDKNKEMKEYLDLQMREKERKRKEELEVGKKQAQVWKKEVEEFQSEEKQKALQVKNVNMSYADTLKKQIEDEKKKQKKMNTEELLLNKPKLVEIASKVETLPFHKQIVHPVRHY